MREYIGVEAFVVQLSTLVCNVNEPSVNCKPCLGTHKEVVLPTSSEFMNRFAVNFAL